jgi:predicted nucleic acid-binding protein
VIGVDTSTIIAFLRGESGADTMRLAEALADDEAAIPAPVLTEALSNPNTREAVRVMLSDLPRLPLDEGAWERAAQTRGVILSAKRRAYLADTLIAQACIDADVPLLTRDRDFSAFAELAGLKLA